MSARRQARAVVERALTGQNGVPLALAVGRVHEVWGDSEPGSADPQSIRALAGTRRRFGLARAWWLESAGIEERHGWSVIPVSATWSAAYLIENDRATEAVERLARRGCSLDDLPRLKSEAQRLYARAVRQPEDAEPPRRQRRLRSVPDGGGEAG